MMNLLGEPSAIAVLLIAFTVCVVLSPWVRMLGWKLGLVDSPGTRKIHKQLVARSGGVSIAAAVLIAVIVGNGLLRKEVVLSLTAAPLLAGLISSFVGLLDDLTPQRAAVRLLGQLIGVGAFLGFTLREFQAFAAVIDAPFGVVLAAAGFILLAGINSINLIDGVDGLASTLTALTCAGVLIALNPGAADAVILLAVAGAALGFLPGNLRREGPKLFLGDSGSLFLGGVVTGSVLLAVVKIGAEGSFSGDAAFAFLLPVALVGVPLIDEGVCVLRRPLVGRLPSRADQSHIHHFAILSSSRGGNPELQTLFKLIALQAIVIACAIAALRMTQWRWWIVLAAAGVVAAVYARNGLLTLRYLRLGPRVVGALRPCIGRQISDGRDAREVLDGFAAALQAGDFRYARMVYAGGERVFKAGERNSDFVRFPLPFLGHGNEAWLDVGIQGRLMRDVALAALLSPALPAFQRALALEEQDREVHAAEADTMRIERTPG